MKSQKGITLLEVLLTLSILSFVAIIVWNVLFQGLNFSSTVQTQTLLQQETHSIITAMRNIHQTSDQYKIYYSSDPHSSFIKIESDTSIFEFSKSDFYYELYRINETGEVLFGNEDEIEPNSEDLQIKVIIYDQKKPKLSYTNQAYISKLRNR